MHRHTSSRVRRTIRFALGTALAAALLSSSFADASVIGASFAGLRGEEEAPAVIDPELQQLIDQASELDAEVRSNPANPSGEAESDDANEIRHSSAASPDPIPSAAETAATQATRNRVEVMIYFADAGVDLHAQGDPELAAASLQQNADAHWTRIDAALTELEQQGSVSVLNRFWVTSAVLVSAVDDQATLDALAALPGATNLTPNYEIEGLSTEEPTPVDAPSIASSSTAAVGDEQDESPVTYGIEQIRADEAWRDFGAEGQGVRVAVLDTGVDATHPDIAARLVGRDTGDPSYPGGWINFDRYGNPIVTKPTDPGSHGTHVAGTIVGGAASGTQIGVAPAAELMAANVLSGGGSSAKILRALEWVIEPFDGEGNPVGRAADVINMSLGSGAYDASLIQPLRNLRDAGIFPAIAIGNAPCGTNGTSSPGDIYEAFGVGMTNSDDEIDAGSCGAVTNWPTSTSDTYGWPQNFVKPDASAPGVRVFSAMPNGLWGESTGTSMATPHVAGAVALLRSAQGGLSVDQLETALESTAWHPTPGTAPDTRYGHGRIDVHTAIASVLGASGITGTVKDATTGQPVSGVEISYGDRGETWVTDEQGRFTARLVPGEYTLEATRFGFEPGTSGPVTVGADRFTEVSIGLTAITVGSIGGIVVDHRDGSPLEGATVSLLGQPITATTAADGSYRFDDLPIGEYRIRTDAEGMSSATSEPAEVRAALTTTVNFRLAPLPRVLVLGDNGGRTAALVGENGFMAESSTDLPDDLADLAAYDAVLWDGPGSVTAERLRAAIAATDASGTGIVWLDLGDDEDSGIATLQRELGDPAIRESGNDRTLTATGYRITTEHPIFEGGALSTEPLTVGSVLRQNTAEGGPKFYAWFESLTGVAPTVLGETVLLRTTGNNTDVQSVGQGIAIDERADNRHVFLALHGSSSAIDARSWSLASTQLLLNSLTWASPEISQAPSPEIIVPEPPVIPPGDGGDRPTPTPPTTTTTPTKASLRSPATQAKPQPDHTPNAPVSEFNQLTASTSGGVTLRLEGGIAHVKIPDSKPGDWFFLHVYPGSLPVAWIRVNDDGELRIDTAKLPAGTYRLAFTNADDRFVGWTELVIKGAKSVAQPVTKKASDDASETQMQQEPQQGFALSLAEQLMLLGAALIMLAAAGVVVFANRGSAVAASAASPSSETDSSTSPTDSGDPLHWLEDKA